MSYSHESAEHQSRVLALAKQLRNDGVDVNCDSYEPAPPEGWPLWMDQQIANADFVLLICTTEYHQRLMGEPCLTRGKGVAWEGRIVYQHIYDNETNRSRFIPIITSAEDVKFIPKPLGANTYYDLAAIDGYGSLYRRLTSQPRIERPPLGTIKSLSPEGNTTRTGPTAVEVVEQYKAVTAQVVDLRSLSPNFPPSPLRELSREQLVSTIESVLAGDIYLITVEGCTGIGKTVLAAQFANAFPQRAITIFVRASSRLSYDPENIRLHLADQLYWAAYQERAPRTDVVGVELKYLYTEIQRKARRKGLVFYFVIDGLADIPQYASGVIESILELFPIGEEGFRFVLTGDLRLYTPFLHKSLSVKSFQVTHFGLDDTLKYFEGICQDRDLIKDLHVVCRGVPGRLADVRRSVLAGSSVKECLAKLSENHPHLFAFEWQQLDKSNDILVRVLSILAHDDKTHTSQSLSDLVCSLPPNVLALIEPLSFIDIDKGSGVITFVSDAFRHFAADQLRSHKTWVHKANIKHLLLKPDSDQALLELPLHLAETADFETLLQYLTPMHILAMLQRTHNLTRVQATVESGLSSAKRLERDADMLRFGIEESILVDFLVSGVGVSEAEALASLGDFTSALAIANAALLREDRLHILAAIGKAKRKRGQVLEPELLGQIRSLAKQIDPKTLGERAIDIAAHLICVDPELALDIVDEAKPSDVEREKAFARLSFLTLDALGQDHSTQTLETIKARGFGPKVDLMQRSMSILSGDWSTSELLAHLDRIEKPKDKLALIRSWLGVNNEAAGLIAVIKYALELAIRTTDFLIDAAILRALADPLDSQATSPEVRLLIGMFDAQTGSAAKVGPFVEYVRLQIALARCEARFDAWAAENRLLGIFYEIVQICDITTKTEAWAWLLDGVSAIEDIVPYSFGPSLAGDIGSELDNSFVALLDGTADHGRSTSGVIEALTYRHGTKAFEYISMLNTEDRRNQARFKMIRTMFKVGQKRLSVSRIESTLSALTAPSLLDEAVEYTVDRLCMLKRGPVIAVADFQNIIDRTVGIASASSRCRVCAQVIGLNERLGDIVSGGLKEKLLEHLHAAWKAIDVGWLRVSTGFEIAEALSSDKPELSAHYLKETETLRAGLGGFANRDADVAYMLTLRLATRAFSGLVGRRVYSKQDLERLAVLIDALPGFGERALIWGDLAVKCAIKGDRVLSTEIVNERIRPLIAGIPDGDREFKEIIISSIAPALYGANANSALGMISKLTSYYREQAHESIVDCLLRNRDPSDPEDYTAGAGYNIEYTRILSACDVAMLLQSDYTIYVLIERMVDTITNKKLTIQLTGSQKDEVYRRLLMLSNTKFPAPGHIKHDGYKVIARAQLARFRADPDMDDLAATARQIPNIADRALVMFATGTAVSKAARDIADGLIEDAKRAVSNIPADWDRLERLIGFAYDAKRGNPLLSRQMLEQAIKLVSKTSEGREHSMRRIVDLSYRIDAVFAKELAEKFDDDVVRKAARRQIEVLQIKQKVVDEKPAYEELQIASRTEFRRLGAMLLGSLQSDRMDSVKPQSMRPNIQAAARQPIRHSYFVLSWIIENSIERHGASDKAGYYLRPVYDATLAAAELAAALANRTFSEMKSAREQFGAKGPASAKNLSVQDREQAIIFLRVWLESNAKQTIVLCDPAFHSDDLLLLQLVKASGISCRVIIVTNNSDGPPPSGASWGTFFTSQWRELSEQSAPPTRITMISPLNGGKALVQKCCLVSEDVGVELNDSVRSIGLEDSPNFRYMDFDEVDAIMQNVKSLLTDSCEWSGTQVRVEIYSL